MPDRISFIGGIRHGSRQFDRVITLTLEDHRLRFLSDDLRGFPPSVLDDSSPDVIRWLMNVMVILENQEAHARTSATLHRITRIRHEAIRRQDPMIPCPECQGIAEVYIDDRLTTCPRCDGLGMI